MEANAIISFKTKMWSTDFLKNWLVKMYIFITMSAGLTSGNGTQGPGYLALQEEEDSSLDKAAIEALPAPPG